MLEPTNEQSMHAEWSHVADRVARLLVRQSVGLIQARSGDVRSLALGGAEVVRASSGSCDDGWVLEVGAPATPGAPVPASILGHFEEFAAGSRAAGRGEALGLLPAGEYLVVRSSRAPVPTRFVVLGNERFEAAAHEQALFDAPPAPHVVVVGDRRGEPPRLDRLLIGIALSGFGGLASDGTVALAALALAGGTRGAGPEASTGDLIMVVPIDGDLVITHFKQTEVEWPKVVSALAQRLAGLPQLPRLDFGVDSDQVARLRVERDPYELPAVRAIRGGPTAELCVHGRVAVKLTTTRGPAAEWTVARDLTVRLEDAEPEWDFAGPYLAWEEGSIARGGLGVFAALPAGEYAIARVPASRLRAPGLVAGGTRIAIEAEHLGQPLVGLVGLGPEGEELLVLQPLVRVPAPAGQDGDAIVVVPVSGELVVDAGGRGQQRLNAWRHRARRVFQ